VIGIAEMFAELNGYQRYEDALDSWSSRRDAYMREYRADPFRRRKAVETMRAWRKANPERAREQSRLQMRRWKERNPDAYRAWQKRTKERYRQRHPEKVRERNRRNQAARRARLKAQGVAA
jgi:hypothetical protein